MNDIDRLRQRRITTARRERRRAWERQFWWGFELNWPSTLFGRIWACLALLIPPALMLLALWSLRKWSPRKPNVVPPDDDRGPA